MPCFPECNLKVCNGCKWVTTPRNYPSLPEPLKSMLESVIVKRIEVRKCSAQNADA
jgi:hypothetical protein